MPRLPRNLHSITTSHSRANAISDKHATRHVWRAAPATKNGTGHVQSAAPATKNVTHVMKTLQKYCACHEKRFSTRRRTRPHVTKCHACHAKRCYATRETSKNDRSWKTSYRHGHMAIPRTVANGCGRLRTVGQHPANTPLPPHLQSETGTLATHSGKNIATSDTLKGFWMPEYWKHCKN